MSEQSTQRVIISDLVKKKENKEHIIALTAYDFPSAKIVDRAGVDIILVGDSLGMVVLGYEDTIPVSMDEMIHHTKAVTRGTKRALVVGDMPYMSFQVSKRDAIKNAFRFIKEAGARAVKIEGASPYRLEIIHALMEADIPVMGHVGLTPQSINRIGSFKVRGKDKKEADVIITQAEKLEDAGVFSIILECIPLELARVITQRISVPTIGIGAGPFCDGQILVFHDLLGYSNGYLPKYVKKYVNVNDILIKAIGDYVNEVSHKKFPLDKHSYHSKTIKKAFKHSMKS
ncbi:MAG: 3-methyl-2-oxobutanoate hydroxymethyltransferase [Candidatus Aminicenantes bacterium]|nr:3-methyl-2-oxobutanoate hydroxymethyltransferase [Candidatus Aminicenantes bacterium]